MLFYPSVWKCTTCQKDKKSAEFSKDRWRKYGLSYTCKQCEKEEYENNKSKKNN